MCCSRKTNKDQKLKPEDQRHFILKQPYGSYVMENILFKISFPAEFHSQTACEAAVRSASAREGPIERHQQDRDTHP